MNMRQIIVIVLFLMLPIFSQPLNAAEDRAVDHEKKQKNEESYIPENLEDCFIQVDKILPDSVKQSISTQTESEFSANMHLGLGIRASALGMYFP